MVVSNKALTSAELKGKNFLTLQSYVFILWILEEVECGGVGGSRSA